MEMLLQHLMIFLLIGIVTGELRDAPTHDDLASLLTRRRSESAEKYFTWIRKTQRPVEYFRGKRFWLFGKKDDPQPVNTEKHASLAQGLWRSGIVGRR